MPVEFSWKQFGDMIPWTQHRNMDCNSYCNLKVNVKKKLIFQLPFKSIYLGPKDFHRFTTTPKIHLQDTTPQQNNKQTRPDLSYIYI